MVPSQVMFGVTIARMNKRASLQKGPFVLTIECRKILLLMPSPHKGYTGKASAEEDERGWLGNRSAGIVYRIQPVTI
jgi:hypothetical protein